MATEVDNVLQARAEMPANPDELPVCNPTPRRGDVWDMLVVLAALGVAWGAVLFARRRARRRRTPQGPRAPGASP